MRIVLPVVFIGSSLLGSNLSHALIIRKVSNYHYNHARSA